MKPVSLRPQVAALLTALALGAASAAGADVPHEGAAKPDRDVTTIGPPAALSPAQRAAIAAKRALRFSGPAPSPWVAPAQKPASVRTLASVPPGAARTPRPAPARGVLAPAVAAPREPVAPTTEDARVSEIVRGRMGLERARAAGLVKDVDRAPAGKERRP